MRIVQLDGVDDSRFADRVLYRVIGDHRELRGHGLFVAEGRLVVERLIEQRFPVRSLLVNEAALRALEPACASLGDDVTAFVCDTNEFERLTGYNIHRGCLALVTRPVPLTLDAIVADARALVLLEDVANADNVGGIFRNACSSAVGARIRCIERPFGRRWRRRFACLSGSRMPTSHGMPHWRGSAPWGFR
jgi:tRNA G18 (ribose-2'-O)-methylase SpoU